MKLLPAPHTAGLLRCFRKVKTGNAIVVVLFVPKSILLIVDVLFHVLSILNPLYMIYSPEVVPCGFEVKQPWLQFGYKIFEECLDKLESHG